ncbi:nitroreductase family deazaflavin-dependent oxidoreductase [Actinoplanes sp. LDG1-06]|uniref:Nitroreductase family deazaflavin-dependent oxidoreductase n=1 Tax=Paractinoplanes ovalisporus TaxID=2810368 RepID=A0ABS2AJL4_9ACTN|nr:nitroreductase family deazaflavin-dependent oxidoreductase [Actinoplanes ovalisporus]
MMSGRVRKNARMMGFNVLVLHTVGRRSGVERTHPVGWFAEPGGGRLIVASANGAADNPAWYYNLAAHPDVRIEVGGRTEEVTAEQLHGDDRERAWQLILKEAPRFAQYATKTDREMPIIRLTGSRGL